MRWAPADYVNDPVVKLALARRDFAASTFYPLFLFHAFMEGGALPSDPVLLGAIVGMKRADVEKAVGFWVEHGKLQIEDGRIFHRRIVREVAEELEFRAQQAEFGRKGGKAGGKGRAQGEPEGSPNPPSPAPTTSASASALRQTPEARQATGSRERVSEGHALITAVAEEAGLDPSEVIRKASDWNGRGYVRLDTMSPARLDQTIVALKRWQRELRGEPEPELPQARAAPKASERALARDDASRAMVTGGLKGDGTVEVGHDGRGMGAGNGRTGLGLGPGRRDAGEGGRARPALPAPPGRPDR
jgi:hypothetical protein